MSYEYYENPLIIQDDCLYHSFPYKTLDWKTEADVIKQLSLWRERNSLECICKHLKDHSRKKNTLVYRHLFITISLPLDYDVKKCNLFTPKILPCCDDEALWCFEFYGKNLQYHPHIHLLIKTTKKLDKKRIIQKLAKHFNIAYNFIDYKYSAYKHLFNQRVDYVKGLKTDSKSPQLTKDISFRQSHDIKCYYSL